jgi:hypothetical protein
MKDGGWDPGALHSAHNSLCSLCDLNPRPEWPSPSGLRKRRRCGRCVSMREKLARRAALPRANTAIRIPRALTRLPRLPPHAPTALLRTAGPALQPPDQEGPPPGEVRVPGSSRDCARRGDSRRGISGGGTRAAPSRDATPPPPATPRSAHARVRLDSRLIPAVLATDAKRRFPRGR